MGQLEPIKTFDGGHGRKGRIWTETGVCTICDEEKPVIVSDGSDGEYDVASLCQTCVTAACAGVDRVALLDENGKTDELEKRMAAKLFRVHYQTTDYFEKFNEFVAEAIADGLLVEDQALATPERPTPALILTWSIAPVTIECTFEALK